MSNGKQKMARVEKNLARVGFPDEFRVPVRGFTRSGGREQQNVDAAMVASLATCKADYDKRQAEMEKRLADQMEEPKRFPDDWVPSMEYEEIMGVITRHMDQMVLQEGRTRSV